MPEHDSFDDIDQLFNKYFIEDLINGKNKVVLSKDVLTMLEKELSHIEFSTKDRQLGMTQRNIYSGNIIEVTMDSMFRKREQDFQQELKPIGMKTSDFWALFDFSNRIEVHFLPKEEFYIVRSPAGKMEGIVAKCVYDELIEIHPINKPASR